jgi:MoaA/NifB/PqqE/SkfB family radical SAM enzyme
LTWKPQQKVFSKFSLEITTASKCPMNCVFCPQEAFQKAYHGCNFLSLANFKVVLANLPKDILLIFSGFVEPFLNPETIEMIEHANRNDFVIQIYSTLIGLSLDDIEQLKECKHIQFFMLHLPDPQGNAKIPITQNYKDVLVSALTNLHIDKTMSMNGTYNLNNRANLLDFDKHHVKGWFHCSRLDSPQFLMLPNCDVVLCCQDFGLKHRLGNLLKQGFWEIAESEAYRKIRSNRFRFDGDVLCRTCSEASPYDRYLLRQCSRRVFSIYHSLEKVRN